MMRARSHLRSLLALLVLAAPGCAGSSGATDTAEELACPELGGSVDPLEHAYSDDPSASGRIRAFVATTRGLADAVLEMERLATDSCRRMARDLGVLAASPTSVRDACAPVHASLSRTLASGVEIRIALVAPKCDPESTREARCGSLCPSSSPECQSLCQAQAALYAECTLPAVSVAISSQTADALALASTLERNLPPLLYAEFALGKRLAGHAGALAALATRLPQDVSSAGPRGVACVALSAALVGKAVVRFNEALNESQKATALLAPEVHPSATVSP